ncbi:ABC transporter substrate-binding protein [Frankia canadensis]|nr:ABC transporter substrate-binding protein [Frankia canadensis]
MTVTGLAVVLLVGGCSASAGPSSTGACASPGFSPTEVRLGLLYPNTGILASTESPVRAGIAARIGLANDNGGIHGRRVVLDWRDDASSPGGNSAAAHDLVERGGVFGLIEETAVAAGSAQYLDENDVPVIGSAVEPAWALHKNMFAIAFPYVGEATTTFGLYARKSGGTKAFMLSAPLSQSSNQVVGKLVTSLASQGIPVVGRADFSDGITPPDAVAAKFAASGANVLTGAVSGPAMASVVAALRSAHIEFKVAFSPTGYEQALVEHYGPAIAGMSVSIYYEPFEEQTPEMRKYQEAMHRYAPELAKVTQPFALDGYIAADLFIHGLERAGDCPTRQEFMDTLRSIRYDAGGLLPSPLNLNEPLGDRRMCYFFVRVDAAGTGFETVPSDAETTKWCGDRVAGQ